jgi:uncharacterized protein
MIYLLDVSALVALGDLRHEFHGRVARWVSEAGTREEKLATCSVAELGFVRVLVQAPQYGFTVSQACELLVRLKTSSGHKLTFIADDQDISRMPAWVRTGRQITDGHLLQLAHANGAILATLDRGIPRAFVIP